jgi:ABC-type multidrug transport system ATPase subunit
MLEIRNLSKIFQSKRGHGLNNFNLQINPGELIALMGPNGSGKTTLLKILAAIIKPDCGEINTNEIKDHIFFLEAEGNSGSDQEIDNQNLIEEKRSFAQWMNLTSTWDARPAEFSTGTKYKWKQLSTFLNLGDTKLLLLDEPFAHLDESSTNAILENLKDWSRQHNTSVIWSTHHLASAIHWADRIVNIKQGKKIFDGTPFHMLFRPATAQLALELGHLNLLLGYLKEDALFETPEGTWNLRAHSKDLTNEQIEILKKSSAEFPCCLLVEKSGLELQIINDSSQPIEHYPIGIKSEMAIEQLNPVMTLVAEKSGKKLKIELPSHLWEKISYDKGHSAKNAKFLLSLKENCSLHLLPEF